MGYVYVYAADAEDLTTTGLVGALMPISCEHEEVANGVSAITLVHPFDEEGRWKALQRGNLLSAPCRVRTTPEIAGGQVVTAIEIWTVKATATKAERAVYTQKTKGRKKGTLIIGREVVVLEKGETRYRLKFEVWNKKRKRYTWSVGWAAHEGIEFKLSTVLDENTDAIESVCPAVAARQQLFRVHQVQHDTEGGTITSYAVHISSDGGDCLTSYDCPEPLTALKALEGLAHGCDYAPGVSLYTDIGDSRTSLKVEDRPLAEALLDPEEGFAARWGAELIRDDEELYFLRRAGRNRGVRIEHGKNLIGATLEMDDANVVTAVKPRGGKKDGSTLYLTDDPGSPDNYVISAYAEDYPMLKCAPLDCEDCTVNSKKGGKEVTVAIARARMREQAQAQFDEEKIDVPDVNLAVNFVELGQTEEYARYAELETTYIHDEVAVVDKVHGIEVMTTVKRMLWDCLAERVIEVELGNIRSDASLVYSWQVQALPGYKVRPGTLPGGALEDESIPPEKLDADLQAALDQAWADIAGAQALLTDTRAWLEGVAAQIEPIEQAVTDNAGSITALRQTAEEIRAGLLDAEGSLAAVSLTASELSTAMEDAKGNISTLQQTSGALSSTVSGMSGEISGIRQTATDISTLVNGPGGLASQVEQLADRIVIKIEAPDGSASMEINKRSREYNFGEEVIALNSYGMDMYSNATLCGSLTAANNLTSSLGTHPIVAMQSMGDVILQSFYGTGIGATMAIGRDPSTGFARIMSNADLSPALSAQCSLGSAAQKWKDAYLSGSVKSSSDERLKRDIEPLDMLRLLPMLKPRSYRMMADGESGIVRWGLVAQEVKGALASIGVDNVELYDGSNADSLGLSYMELIAVLIEGWQAHEARIKALEERLTRLEAVRDGGAI